MFSELIKYISIYLLSTTKFVAGPSMGAAFGMPTIWVTVLSVLGMMTSVFIFTVIGERAGYPWINKLIGYVKGRKGMNDKFQYLWEKFGVVGVTFLTPIFFTPIVGTILVSAMGSPRGKIIIYMFFSAVFWSITLSKIVKVIV